MKKHFKLICSIFFCFAVMLITSLNFTQINVHAEEDPVGYNIQMVKAENQMDNDVSYYDLRVKPGQKQTIYLRINNTSAKDSEYSININPAYTNDQGFIDYSDSKKANSTVKPPYNIRNIFKYNDKIKVGANSQKNIPIYINIPKEKFDGQILAGINVFKANQKQEKGKITNRYNYILGIKLTETDNSISRKLKLIKVYPGSTFAKASVIAVLENPTMDAYGHLKYSVDIKRKSDNKTITKKRYDNGMQIAPNSKYNFSVDIGKKNMVRGKYVMNLKVADAKGNNWKFSRDFQITQSQADSINRATVGESDEKPDYIWWTCLILALLAIFIVIYMISKERKKEK